MAKRILLSEVKRRLFEKYASAIAIVDDSFISVCEKATFIDVKFGAWIVRPSHVLAGAAFHPKHKLRSVRNTRRNSIENVIDRLNAVHKGHVSIKPETYINAHTKALFIDDRYGEWWAICHIQFYLVVAIA